MTVKIPSSAATVRAWAADNSEQFSAEALATVAPGARGRIAPEIRKAFNKSHRHNPYDETAHRGRVTVVGVPTVNSKGVVSVRQQALPADEVREIARDLGLVGPASRGRYPAGVLAEVGAALAKF